MAKKTRVPDVFSIAKEAIPRRHYITPEDVGDAIKRGCPLALVQQQVLETIGGAIGWGAEDAELCAYVASKKTAKKKH